MHETNALTLSFPATSGYLTVSRLNAAAVGASAGFDVEELDDLRLAINEAATWLLADEAAGGAVELVLSGDEGRVTIEGRRSGTDLPQRQLDDLSDAILGATVDEYLVSQAEPNERHIRLVKAKAPNA